MPPIRADARSPARTIDPLAAPGSSSASAPTREAPPPQESPPGLPLRRSRSAPGRIESRPARQGPPEASRPALEARPHAVEADPTRRMPGAFDPLPAADARSAAPVGGAGGVPSHRDANPVFGYANLKAQLPPDVEGCVAHMLRSMEADVGDTTRLAAQQAATLRAHGIDDRDKFVALLSNVSWRDYGTAMLHGMASGSGFAVGGAAVDWAAAQGLSELVADKLPHLPAGAVGLVAGSALGFSLSVMDIASGASAGKTFEAAYFTRPPAPKLPGPWQGARPHTRASLANDMQMAAGLSYGALRNGLVRVPITVGLEATGHSATRQTIDNVIDPVGGLTIGAGGMRLGRNLRDEGAGRAGLQHFLARSDLDECLAFLSKPASAQVGSALARLGHHMVNLGTTLPQATLDAFASKLGWVSHAVLAPGFGGVFAIVEGMPGALAARGLSKEAASVCTQLAKFSVLQCLYQGWGASLGAVAAGPAARPHDLEEA